jgi:integrase/recombinase XerD
MPHLVRWLTLASGRWALRPTPHNRARPSPVSSSPHPPVLRLAVAAYQARFKGQSRVHTESDLRGHLLWCQSRQLDPLAATRPHIELYVRWLQEVRRYRPSTVSRRV